MRVITDGELVLFHYRDGLDPARQAQIAEALARDAALSARYALLQATLDASALDPAPEPSAAFTRRLQQHVATLVAAPATPHGVPSIPTRAAGARGFGRRRWLQRGAAAAAAVLLLAGA
jgi:anti-sigma factor RsiW